MVVDDGVLSSLLQLPLPLFLLLFMVVFFMELSFSHVGANLYAFFVFVLPTIVLG